MNILYRIIYVLLINIFFGLGSCAQGEKLSRVDTRDVDISQLLAEKVIAFRLFYDKNQETNNRTEIGENKFGFEVYFDHIDFDSGNCIHNYRFRAPETGYYHIDLRFQASYYGESVMGSIEDCDYCAVDQIVDRDREMLLCIQKGDKLQDEDQQIFKIHSKLLFISQQTSSNYPFAYSTIIKLEKGAVLVPLFNESTYTFASFSGYKIY